MKKWLLGCLVSLVSLNAEAAEMKILALAGSTRANSYNKLLVEEAARIARAEGAIVTIIDLKDYPMPFYDADLEEKQKMPEQAKRFRALMIKNDALIIASPEYNGSFPGILKNALDWASRSEEGGASRDAFKGKKCAIMSASPGVGGGARGLVHLRAILEAVGGEVIPLQVTVSKAYEAFDEKGNLINADLKQQLTEEVKQLLVTQPTT